jgi:hypothetical protein
VIEKVYVMMMLTTNINPRPFSSGFVMRDLVGQQYMFPVESQAPRRTKLVCRIINQIKII